MGNQVKKFDNMGVTVRFLDDAINTEGTMGEMVITVLSALVRSPEQSPQLEQRFRKTAGFLSNLTGS